MQPACEETQTNMQLAASSSTGLRGAEKRPNSRVRTKACEGGQSCALSDESAAAAGHIRHTMSHAHGVSPEDRPPATEDVGEDGSERRSSKREGTPGGAASASPGGASSRERRRGTTSPAASRSAAAPGPTPAPKPSARTAEASPLSAASQHAQRTPPTPPPWAVPGSAAASSGRPWWLCMAHHLRGQGSGCESPSHSLSCSS